MLPIHLPMAYLSIFTLDQMSNKIGYNTESNITLNRIYYTFDVNA